MEEDRERILRIEIPPCTFSKTAEETEWSNTAQSNGWTPIIGVAIGWEGTIDLSGYARDYKTFYPSGGVLQEGPYMQEVGGDGSITYTVVSSVPLDPLTVFWQLSSPGGPGFINDGTISGLGLGRDQQDWNTIMFAESKFTATNGNIVPNTEGIQQTIETRQSGSISPTAAQVLYCLKIVAPFGTAQTLLAIPASRVILPGTMNQEPELEYMMRLARSVELANQV